MREEATSAQPPLPAPGTAQSAAFGGALGGLRSTGRCLRVCVCVCVEKEGGSQGPPSKYRSSGSPFDPIILFQHPDRNVSGRVFSRQRRVRSAVQTQGSHGHGPQDSRRIHRGSRSAIFGFLAISDASGDPPFIFTVASSRDARRRVHTCACSPQRLETFQLEVGAPAWRLLATFIPAPKGPFGPRRGHFRPRRGPFGAQNGPFGAQRRPLRGRDESC